MAVLILFAGNCLQVLFTLLELLLSVYSLYLTVVLSKLEYKIPKLPMKKWMLKNASLILMFILVKTI